MTPVDQALADTDSEAEHNAHLRKVGLGVTFTSLAAITLAAEVRRLRKELVFAQPLFSRRALEAKLARVESLPARWRERSAEEHDAVARNVERELALELEEELRCPR